MNIAMYDKEKHAAAVEHVSALDKERRDLAMSMTESWQKRGKDKWTDGQFMDHRAGADRHQMIVNELTMAEAVVDRYERLAPKPKQTETQQMQDPMYRWGLMAFGKETKVENIFNAEEMKVYMVSGGDLAPAIGVPPDQLGLGFKIRFPEQALASYGLNPQMRVESDATTGEVINPEATLPRIIQRLLAFGGAARFGEMFTTPRGNDLVLPNLDDTAANKVGQQRGDQDTAVSKQDLANIGGQTFKAYTYTSKGIQVSYEAEQDSIPTLMNVIQDIAGRRIGRIRNVRLTNGTGTEQPLGIVTCAKEAFTTAGSNTITADEIVDLIYSVDDGYIEGEGDPLGFDAESGAGLVGFMIARDVEKFLVKLKDTQNRPLWLPSIQSRLGGMIYGHPYVKNFSMSPLTLNNGHSIVFGNGNYYGIRQVQDVTFFRFFDSATALSSAGKLGVQFVAIARGDGQPRGGFSAANVTDAFQSVETKA